MAWLIYPYHLGSKMTSLGSGRFVITLDFTQASSLPRRADQGEKVLAIKLLPLVSDVTLGKLFQLCPTLDSSSIKGNNNGTYLIDLC